MHAAGASARLRRDANAKRLGELDESIEKNKEFGDSEVFDASCAKAEYLAQIGDSVSGVA